MKYRMTALLLALVLLVTMSACNRAPQEEPAPDPQQMTEPEEPQEPEPTVGNNPLTGLDMADDYVGMRPVAVVLNNIKVAMPMYGISHVDILFEVPAEGGITRMIGIVQDPRQVPRFGSIRSARDYFLDVAGGFDAVLVHAGGSPLAYSLIKSRKVDSWDGVKGAYGHLYYRDKGRISSAGYEHSLFTTGENLTKEWQKTSARTTHNSGYANGLTFSVDSTITGGSPAPTITAPFSSYKTGVFTYDAASGLYQVSQYGKPFVDGETGEQFAVTNVLVLKTSVAAISGDDKGRQSVKLEGSGEGIYACQGECIPIRWSKSAWDKPFVLTTADGAPLVLKCGKTYVNILSNTANVTME